MAKSGAPFPFRGFPRSPYFTMVPDAVFDELMAYLSGPEFKVMCYVVRRTYGFRKDEDAISIAQLVGGIKKRDGTTLDHGTGLARSAVMNAVRALVDKGILVTVRRQRADGGDAPSLYRLRIEGESLSETPPVLPADPGESTGRTLPVVPEDPRESPTGTPGVRYDDPQETVPTNSQQTAPIDTGTLARAQLYAMRLGADDLTPTQRALLAEIRNASPLSGEAFYEALEQALFAATSKPKPSMDDVLRCLVVTSSPPEPRP